MDLPFRSIDFVLDGSAVAFDVEGTHCASALGTYMQEDF